MDAKGLLEAAWDDVADDYAGYFVPRFAPFVASAVDTLLAHAAALPAGDILIPCCGTGVELPTLRAAPALRERRFVCIDLSTAMLERARAAHGSDPRVSFIHGDASDLRAHTEGPIAGVVSCFGLQQIPAAEVALSRWVAALERDAVASVVFWPAKTPASDFVFSTFQRIVESRLGPTDGSWDEALVSRAEEAGGAVLEDARITFDEAHESASLLWRALLRSSPIRVLASRHGEDVVAEIGSAFIRAMPDGRLRHASTARHLVIRRR
jgi:SAM-dependent methyltransferase